MPVIDDGDQAGDATETDLDKIVTECATWEDDRFACENVLRRDDDGNVKLDRVGVPMVPERRRIREAMRLPDKGVVWVRNPDGEVVGVATFRYSTGRVLLGTAMPGPRMGNILLRLALRVSERTGKDPWAAIKNQRVYQRLLNADPRVEPYTEVAHRFDGQHVWILRLGLGR